MTESKPLTIDEARQKAATDRYGLKANWWNLRLDECFDLEERVCELYMQSHTEALRKEIETLRIQLSACGVGAMSNTERAITENRIGRDNQYGSASLGDVYDAVDREIALRKENDELKEEIETLRKFDER